MFDDTSFAYRNHQARARAAEGAPLEWYERHGVWIVFDQALGSEILRDRSFDAADYEADILDLGKQFDVDVNHAASLLHVIPFNKEGAEHAALRRSMAVAIQARSAAALAIFRQIVTERAARILEREGEADLFEDLLRPAVTAMMAEISRVSNCPFDTDLSPSQSFGIKRPFSPPRLRVIEDKAAQVCGAIAEAGGEPLDAAMRLVGLDVLLGSFGGSLLRDLRESPGIPLSSVNWSRTLPVSALPLVERIASRDCVVAGREITAGQRIQVYTGAFEGQEDPRHFGAGRHLCLGKAMTNAAWEFLVEVLSASRRVVRVERVRHREVDYTFVIPIEIRVKISDV